MSHKYVYLFTEGDGSMRELLGGKGANLAEMTRIGLPVPQGFTISTEACAICGRCAILDGKPCRFPEKMHPCVESQGINIIPTLEENGLEFQYGQNVVTWVSLLLYREN